MKYTDKYINSINQISLDISRINLFKDKTILVTGAGGLICSALTDSLIWMNNKYSLNMKIIAAARNEDKISKRFYFWKKGIDYYYLKYDALMPLINAIDAGYVIHGASNANPQAYIREPVETMIANITGTQNLLEMLKNNGHGRLLYISSSEVYGQKMSGEPYLESDYGYVDLLNPRACYPSSKRVAETLCAAYKKEYEVDFTIVRPGHVYGPTMTDSDNRAASQFLRDAKQGKDIVMKSAGTQLRSYCYVMDCVDAIITVLIKGQSGEAYNISNTDSVVTIKELAECIAHHAKVKLLFQNPTDIEKSGYNMMENSSLCSNKLEGLGWKGKYDLNTGIAEALSSI